MLKSIRLENFKAWKKTGSIRTAKITGLFGANSSGKSSIIQSLLLLKQTAKATDRKQVLNFGSIDDYVRMGSFNDVIHNHDSNNKLSFSIDWKSNDVVSVKQYDDPKKVIFSSSELNYSSSISTTAKDKLETQRISYKIGQDKFELSEKDAKGKPYELKVHSSTNFKFIRTPGRVWPLPGPTKCYGFPEQINAYYQNASFLFDLELEFEKFLKSLYYLGPLRDYPQRDYRWNGGEPEDVGQKGELSVGAILAARERGAYLSPGYKRKRQTIDERIAHWLKELGLIDSFTVDRIGSSNLFEVKVRKTSTSSEVLLPDVGFGVSQVLPVLALCFYAPENSTLIFEQPEIHLHPSVQAGLADVFIDVIKNRNMQIIFESHSEHLLLRLQRRIAEEQASNDDVALYFADSTPTNPGLKPLDVDLFGNISNWPTDFFGDRFLDIAQREKASLSRSK
jgi:predicted ATPase